ncbi:hypothetical protein CANCADRAFT_28759 [Tortispora caseinolytica NRRL Y-17796]|uniref:Uncharacterized protein n=1 Tax=Tortispora caseinolytica NRRL Y-17796 TaxID=767744 RepID=A0A1E4TBB0_9ASCO|nr:hypothetical protein CANCADRAFT_28759 [Tortispora caseinolytica NRRL Y-17796]
MFGAICAGRPVQDNLTQIDENKFAFQIEDGANVNHVVVFLLPGSAFQEGLAASIYFQWPGKPFQLLGGLANSKPSAIFKVKQSANTTGSPSSGPVTITLGISIEPIAQVEQQLLTLHQNDPNDGQMVLFNRPVSPASIVTLANRIVQHLYNYLGGFATPDGMVPMKVFDDWWRKFQERLQVNPSFLDNAIE